MATGAENGPLGKVTQGVTCGLRNGGCRQGYEHGSIYWSPSTGARAMLGAIESLWNGGGAENGLLGYPTWSVSTAADGVAYSPTLYSKGKYQALTMNERSFIVSADVPIPVRTYPRSPSPDP